MKDSPDSYFKRDIDKLNIQYQLSIFISLKWGGGVIEDGIQTNTIQYTITQTNKI